MTETAFDDINDMSTDVPDILQRGVDVFSGLMNRMKEKGADINTVADEGWEQIARMGAAIKQQYPKLAALVERHFQQRTVKGDLISAEQARALMNIVKDMEKEEVEGETTRDGAEGGLGEDSTESTVTDDHNDHKQDDGAEKGDQEKKKEKRGWKTAKSVIATVRQARKAMGNTIKSSLKSVRKTPLKAVVSVPGRVHQVLRLLVILFASVSDHQFAFRAEWMQQLSQARGLYAVAAMYLAILFAASLQANISQGSKAITDQLPQSKGGFKAIRDIWRGVENGEGAEGRRYHLIEGKILRKTFLRPILSPVIWTCAAFKKWGKDKDERVYKEIVNDVAEKIMDYRVSGKVMLTKWGTTKVISYFTTFVGFLALMVILPSIRKDTDTRRETREEAVTMALKPEADRINQAVKKVLAYLQEEAESTTDRTHARRGKGWRAMVADAQVIERKTQEDLDPERFLDGEGFMVAGIPTTDLGARVSTREAIRIAGISEAVLLANFGQGSAAEAMRPVNASLEHNTEKALRRIREGIVRRLEEIWRTHLGCVNIK